MIGQSVMEYRHARQRKWPPVSFVARIQKYTLHLRNVISVTAKLNQNRCFQTGEYDYVFFTQSSVYLRIRGTSGRWSWQKNLTQDIIRQRKDDNRLKT